LKNEVNIETILRELGEFRAEVNARHDAAAVKFSGGTGS